jgi:hypothetical protein
MIATWGLFFLIIQETTHGYTKWTAASTRVSILLLAFAVVVFLRTKEHFLNPKQ